MPRILDKMLDPNRVPSTATVCKSATSEDERFSVNHNTIEDVTTTLLLFAQNPRKLRGRIILFCPTTIYGSSTLDSLVFAGKLELHQQ